MELEIVSREEQELMGREEIEIELSHAGERTPSAAEVRDRISAELDLDPKTVEIMGIYSSSGLTTSTGTVRVHDEPIYDELPEEGEEDESIEEGGEAGAEEETEEEGGDDAEEGQEEEGEDGDAEAAEEESEGEDGKEQADEGGEEEEEPEDEGGDEEAEENGEEQVEEDEKGDS